MALKIRMSRAGAKKRPFYRIVVADSRMPRDGRYIERLGIFNPLLPKEHNERLKLDLERIKHWLDHGAKPSDRIARFLDEAGLWKRTPRDNPQKGKPHAKALERLKAQEEAKQAAAEADSSAAAEAETAEAETDSSATDSPETKEAETAETETAQAETEAEAQTDKAEADSQDPPTETAEAAETETAETDSSETDSSAIDSPETAQAETDSSDTAEPKTEAEAESDQKA
ncbi:MAG: 30S ribosomal protein S16 [Alphaproteobacteria bacterium]|nr:30S ribosomal protein S16 [Alphaproteobacteria bacterium]